MEIVTVKEEVVGCFNRWSQLQIDSKPNGHIFVDSSLIRRRNSTWKVRRNFIDFERRIHVEIMTSTWRGNFDVDSTFKMDEISMSSTWIFLCRFDVEST